MTASFLEQFSFIVANAWLTLTWRDVLDVAVIAVFLYFVFLLFKRTNSFFIVDGVVLLFLAFLVAQFLNLNLTALFLKYFFAFFIVIMAVIFREELRSFFESISLWGKIERTRSGEKLGDDAVVDIVRKTLDYLSSKKHGALLVFPGGQPLDRLLQGGVPLHGDLSVPLLLSIFDPTSPGHDGAALIEDGMLKRFSAHLPLAERYKHLRDVGLRHRAAVGLSEKSDAMVLVVSEERGTISLARFGRLFPLIDAEEAAKRLQEFFDESSPLKSTKFWREVFVSNFIAKLAALVVAALLWFVFVFQPGHATKEFDVPVEFRFLPETVQITKITPTKISVTLSGKSADFDILDAKTLKVSIDASKFLEPGAKKVSVDEEMIQSPRALSIVDFSPETVRFDVVKKEVSTSTQNGQ